MITAFKLSYLSDYVEETEQCPLLLPSGRPRHRVEEPPAARRCARPAQFSASRRGDGAETDGVVPQPARPQPGQGRPGPGGVPARDLARRQRPAGSQHRHHARPYPSSYRRKHFLRCLPVRSAV